MKKHFLWIFPLLAFILIAPFTPILDMKVAYLFYSPAFENQPGHFEKTPYLQFLYHYGEIPAWFFLAVSLVVIIGSYWKKNWKEWNKPAQIYLYTLVFGSLIVTTLILKNFWERPRPVQTSDFGGFAAYHPFWIPLTASTPEHCRSFPCGHCTMGFVFISFCFIGYRMKKPWIFWMGLLLTLILGFELSYMRLAMGGHYISDILASALIMWLSAFSADAFVYRKKLGEPQ